MWRLLERNPGSSPRSTTYTTNGRAQKIHGRYTARVESRVVPHSSTARFGFADVCCFPLRRRTMRRTLGAAVAVCLLAGAAASAQNGTPINPDSNNALTLAVNGDAPYGLNATDSTQ